VLQMLVRRRKEAWKDTRTLPPRPGRRLPVPRLPAPKGAIGSFFGGGRAVGAAQGKQGDVSGTNGGGVETTVVDLTAEDTD
jgi:hypothetical protein